MIITTTSLEELKSEIVELKEESQYAYDQYSTATNADAEEAWFNRFSALEAQIFFTTKEIKEMEEMEEKIQILIKAEELHNKK